MAGVAIGAVPALLTTRLGRDAPVLLRDRSTVSCARTGEVTTDSAVVWARAGQQGRMMLRLESNGRRLRSVRGPWTDARSDYTARLHLRGLTPGRQYDATVWFTGAGGSDVSASAPERLRFRTAPVHAAAQSFVWSGDTCGQGWGINPDLGGLTAYGAMLATRPDFFVHCGDTIYGDEPMEESVVEDSGRIWRNELTEEVTHVAETLADFRGRHRYTLDDANVRALYAEVPTISQWDDHETLNNWYPGELHDDERYSERRCDVLAARGRRAWQEYQPVPLDRLVSSDGDGFAGTRIYRKVPRGQHLDVFCLDMRSYRGVNSGAAERGILGPTQERWLVDSLAASTATWKVVSADLPLSIPSNRAEDLDGPCNYDDGQPLGREPEIARVLSALKHRGVRNVVWITADVHYTAAHRYEPGRATYADFDPFWEFVSGPIAAETFPRKDDLLDQTFGPRVVFSKGNDSGERQSPRVGNQFFGHMHVAATGELTVTLYDGTGVSLWSQVLEPEEQAQEQAQGRARTGRA